MKSAIVLVLIFVSTASFAMEIRSVTPEEKAIANEADADLRLNNIYRELIAALNEKSSPKAKDALIVAQRAWIKQRDAECEFAAEVAGDSAHRSLAFHHAKTRASETRIDWLSRHLNTLRFNGSQSEMNEAAAKDARAADIELNNVYKRYMNSLDDASKKELVEAERAWLAFRTSAVNLEDRQYVGGSIQPLMYLTAFTRITQDWIKELKERENN